MSARPLLGAVGEIGGKRGHIWGKFLDKRVLKLLRSGEKADAGSAFHWRTVRGRKLAWWCEVRDLGTLSSWECAASPVRVVRRLTAPSGLMAAVVGGATDHPV